MIALARHHDRLAGCDLHRRSGTVREVVGLTILASGPAVPVGELCRIGTALGGLPALVIGFRADGILLQPLGRADGIRLGDPVLALGRRLQIPVGPGLIGRVVDGLGRALDGRGPIPGSAARPIHAEPPGPLERRPIAQILETGCRAIDAVCTIGRGQRMGIFAGSGVGKSVLLSMLARNVAADVSVIGPGVSRMPRPAGWPSTSPPTWHQRARVPWACTRSGRPSEVRNRACSAPSHWLCPRKPRPP